MEEIKEGCSYGKAIGEIDPIMTVQQMD